VGGNVAVLRVIPCRSEIGATGAGQRATGGDGKGGSGGVRAGERWRDPERVGTGPVGINA